MADDFVTSLVKALTENPLCLLGAVIFVALIILVLVVLYIRRIHGESKWAYNPDKTLKLRWRRG